MPMLTLRDGAQLYYETDGTLAADPPVVLLHGNGEDRTVFDAQRSALREAGYALLLPDSRAQGRSTRGGVIDPPLPLDYATMAGDLHELLAHLGVQSAHLLGFSDGGNLALCFALAHPAMARSLLLVGANLNPGGVKLRYQAPIVLGYGALALCAAFSRPLRPKRDVMALMVRHPHIDNKALAALHIPALVLAGERDMIRESHTQRIAAALRTQAVILPGATHFLLAEQPAEANAHLLGFLARQTP